MPFSSKAKIWKREKHELAAVCIQLGRFLPCCSLGRNLPSSRPPCTFSPPGRVVPASERLAIAGPAPSSHKHRHLSVPPLLHLPNKV
ncbi:hypothetical protein GOP47_0015710 [Adiantum capillus-veneris]|uniref:Uncharacterized protein n=1 Tax=Adiantum capillus-veneris TaxID=13818 RepID=A0A9D4UK72_ADICA|nr:hypothetical protein GOP47_0015710 [Adiantum capillus-veneris]